MSQCTPGATIIKWTVTSKIGVLSSNDRVSA
jgi:hypothetical protein